MLKELDRLGLGADGDAVNSSRLRRTDAASSSVHSILLVQSNIHFFPSAPLEQIKSTLQDLNTRVKNMGRTLSNEEAKDVSGLIDNIRDAVVGCQVSSKVQMWPAI